VHARWPAVKEALEDFNGVRKKKENEHVAKRNMSQHRIMDERFARGYFADEKERGLLKRLYRIMKL